MGPIGQNRDELRIFTAPISGQRSRTNFKLFTTSLYEPSWPNVVTTPTKKFNTMLILTFSVYKWRLLAMNYLQIIRNQNKILVIGND